MKKSWRNNVEFYLIGLLLLMVIAFSIAMPTSSGLVCHAISSRLPRKCRCWGSWRWRWP